MFWVVFLGFYLNTKEKKIRADSDRQTRISLRSRSNGEQTAKEPLSAGFLAIEVSVIACDR